MTPDIKNVGVMGDGRAYAHPQPTAEGLGGEYLIKVELGGTAMGHTGYSANNPLKCEDTGSATHARQSCIR